MRSSRFGRLAAGVGFSALYAINIASAETTTVGQTSIVVRHAQGVLDASVRNLTVTDPIYWRERIETDANSAAEVTFLDGTTLSAGPRSRVTIDEFVYSASGEQKLVIGITKGIMRFATGAMDSKAYQIRAPGAIIGVRGTVLTVMVDATTKRTKCRVERGEVEFANDSGERSVTISAGQASEVSHDKPDEAPSEPAAPDEAIVEAEEEMLVTLAAAVVPEEKTPEKTVAAKAFGQKEQIDDEEGECRSTRNCLAIEDNAAASPVTLR